MLLGRSLFLRDDKSIYFLNLQFRVSPKRIHGRLSLLIYSLFHSLPLDIEGGLGMKHELIITT